MQNRITDELVAAAQLQDAKSEEVDKAENLSETVREHFAQSRRAVEQYVASHPAVCLAAAAGLGIALGCWIKRK